MPDIFTAATPEEIEKRKIQYIGILLNEIKEKVNYTTTRFPEKFPAGEMAKTKMRLDEIFVCLEALKKKVS